VSNPFLGEIRLFPFNFAPRSWAFCAGQILSIAQNTALFSLRGTTFGGNGTVTFALPDLRGRAAVGVGMGPGLSDYQLGEVGGVESTTLTTNQLPSHSHGFTQNATATATTKSPSGKVPAYSAAGSIYGDPGALSLAGAAIAPTGGNQPVPILPPYLGLHYCIALEGIFPSRN
jgi:microcystin-dependent protein